MDKHITTPITAEVTKDLKSGDYVYPQENDRSIRPWG